MTLGRKILLAYGFVLLAVGLLAAAGAAIGDAYQGRLDAETRTKDLDQALDQLRNQLTDAETGQRGYVITGREVYLEPYRQAVAGIEGSLAEARAALEPDDPVAPLVDQAEQLAQRKLTELQNTIKLRRDQGFAAAEAAIVTDRGRELMDAFRTVLDRISALTDERLLERSARTRETSRAFVISLAALFLLVLVGGALLAMVLRHTLAQRLQVLCDAADRFGAGDMTRRAGVSGNDEIAQVGRAFDQMADLVAAQQVSLRASESHLRAVFDTVGEGIVTLVHGRVQSANQSAARLFGIAETSLLETNLRTRFREAPLSSDDLAKEQLRTGRAAEAIVVQPGGAELEVEVEIRRIAAPTDAAELEPLYVCVVRDVSERKRVERMQAEFISTVSHELRTPLTSIAGSLELIAGGAVGQVPPDAQSLVSIALSNSRRLVRLINDILDVEKIDSGQIMLELRPQPMKALVDQAVAANQAFAAEYDVIYRVVQADASATVRGDSDRLQQVLTNLMSNAAKFAPAGSEVEIAIERADGHVRVSVRDHGSGIPAEFHDRIFQRFAQADSSDRRAKGGTGLGLAISKSIVERHGGSIGFADADGGGTVFWFALPERRTQEEVAAQQAKAAAAATAEGAKPKSTIPVLVIEDDPDIATLLMLLLERAGYSVDCANSAASARSMLRHRRYAAITLDLVLPDLDGVALIRDLRHDLEFRDVPIVVVSAVAVNGKRELNGDAISVVDWIEKPIDSSRLLAAVRRATAGLEARPQILHVEDDPDVALVTAMQLKPIADVTEALSLAAAQAALGSQRFDLILLDITLGDGSGLELLPLARNGASGPIPVIIFSADEMSDEVARAVAATLVKSRASNDELANAIRQAIAHPPGSMHS